MDKKRVYIYNIGRLGEYISAVLLLIFVSYYANVSLFYHSHIMDGVTIVHSHICNSNHTDQSNKEPHSKSELTLISTISNYIAVEQDTYTPLKEAWIDLNHIFTNKEELSALATSCVVPQLRAPPTVIAIG